MELNFHCAGFSVGGGEGESVDEAQQSARMELEQLRKRMAQLEAQLGLRKKRGLCFTVSVPLISLIPRLSLLNPLQARAISPLTP